MLYEWRMIAGEKKGREKRGTCWRFEKTGETAIFALSGIHHGLRSNGRRWWASSLRAPPRRWLKDAQMGFECTRGVGLLETLKYPGGGVK